VEQDSPNSAIVTFRYFVFLFGISASMTRSIMRPIETFSAIGWGFQVENYDKIRKILWVFRVLFLCFEKTGNLFHFKIQQN
jgi:hypothetical protein